MKKHFKKLSNAVLPQSEFLRDTLTIYAVVSAAVAAVTIAHSRMR